METNTLSSEVRSIEPLREGYAMARKRYQKGSVYLRGYIWYGRYWKDVIEDGQRKRKNVCIRLGTKSDYPTKRLAMRALEPLLAEVNSPLYRARPTSTFSQFAQKWVEGVLPTMKPSTAENYRCLLHKRLIPFFGELRLDQINPEVVQHFISASEGSPKTVRNSVMALRSMWKSAEAWGYVTHDPFRGVQLPKQMPTERQYFQNPTDMLRVIEASDEPYKSLYWLAAETGLRAGELCGLQWRDVDTMGRRVCVRQAAWRGKLQSPKSARAVRVVGISEGLAKHLDLQRQKGDGNPMSLLFATRNATPVDPGRLVKWHLQPMLKKLGIPRVGLHAFRHTNATLAHSWGVPLKTMQSRLGHSTPALTLDVYTHARSADEQNFTDKLGEFFGAPTASGVDKQGVATLLGTEILNANERQLVETQNPEPAVVAANSGLMN